MDRTERVHVGLFNESTVYNCGEDAEWTRLARQTRLTTVGYEGSLPISDLTFPIPLQQRTTDKIWLFPLLRLWPSAPTSLAQSRHTYTNWHPSPNSSSNPYPTLQLSSRSILTQTL